MYFLKNFKINFLVIGVTALLTTTTLARNSDDDKTIHRFHQSLLTIDSHVDISREYMLSDDFDPGLKTHMKVDFDKMKRGGIDGVFFIVYVAQKKRDAAGYHAAYLAAMKKFTTLHKMLDEDYPQQIKLAYSPEDVLKIHEQGKLIAMIGVENGYPIDHNLEILDQFYHLGARYMGLTHSGNNDICDSSSPSSKLGDNKNEDKGLSQFGRSVVKRMNDLGMMIDVSHASDQCVKDVLTLSRAPIIASHSGTRALMNHPRNLPDELLKQIADKGGVIQIVGYTGFIKADPARDKAFEELEAKVASHYHAREFSYKLHENTPEYIAGTNQINKDYPLATVQQYVDQIDHAIKIAGIDHVGISSDFDGGGELRGWEDASQSENITRELLRRGYSKTDIQKIWSGNLLTTWKKIASYRLKSLK